MTLAPTPSTTRVGRERALLWALGAAVFMINLDSRVVAPLLPELATELHVSLAQAGWLVSSYMLPYGLLQLVYGPIADRLGKINVCAAAMLAFSVGTAFCSYWPTFVPMLVLRALTGAAAAGLIPLILAYIGDTVPYERRQATLASLMASAGAAQAFSTSAGGSIAAFVSWRWVFPCLGVLAGAVTVAIYALKGHAVQSARIARPSFVDALRTPLMLPLLALVACEGFLFSGAFSYLSGLLDQRFGLSALEIGLVLSLTGASQLLSARVLPRILGRVSERWLVGAGGGIMGAAYLLAAFATGWPLVATACALLGFGFLACHTTLQTRITEILPAGRGTAVALFAFSLFLGGGLGTAILGAVLDPLGFTNTWFAVRTLSHGQPNSVVAQ
jgi:predicted MFS family arabinose efflux permease